MIIGEDKFIKICKIRDNFIEEISGRKLYSYQKRFSDKILKCIFFNTGETTIAEFTRQSGKTTLVVDTVAFLLLFYFPICQKFNIDTTPQFNVGFFAPQIEQARSAFNMLRDFLRKCENKGFDFEFDSFNGNIINMKSKAYPPRTVFCMTASPTSKQESKTLNLIIFDESQDLIDKVVDKSIIPMGASTNAPEIFIGVGGYQRCRFLEHIDKLPDENKFIVPYQQVLNEMEELFQKDGNNIHLNYKKHIEKRLREIGEDSDEFKTQYKLLWILERGQFITYDALMNLERHYVVHKEYKGVDKLYAGIDWGKAYDATVLTFVNENCEIVAWFSWQGDDYASQIEEIVYLIANKYSSTIKIFCDSTGNQDMAVDILKAKLRGYNTQVEAVNFNAKSKDEMYKNLSRLMNDKYIGGNKVEEAVFKFPAECSNEMIIHKEKFIKQMCDLQKNISKQGLWQCQHPDGPSYHDDYTDSTSLACLGFLPRIERKIAYQPMIG